MSKSSPSETFGDVFREILAHLRYTLVEMGARLGVTPKTLRSWCESPPAGLRARAIVEAFTDLPIDLRRRLAASLGVSPPEDPAARDAALIKGALEGALFEAAESLNVPARDVQKGQFAALLARMGALGVDVATASAMIAPAPEVTRASRRVDRATSGGWIAGTSGSRGAKWEFLAKSL